MIGMALMGWCGKLKPLLRNLRLISIIFFSRERNLRPNFSEISEAQSGNTGSIASTMWAGVE
jgi:hypothetical protein